MVLGVVVLLIVGTLVFRYLKNNKEAVPQELLNQENSVESSTKTHKVAEGENLWQIAEENYGDGFKWVDIATENKLSNASEIEVDQELTIPNLETPEPSVAGMESEVKAVTTTDGISGDSYTVVKGDSLWKIAVRAYGDGYKWVEIARENELVNPNIVHAGNVLTLPR